MIGTGTVPLAMITRSGNIDNFHRGAVVVCDRDDRVLYSAGDPDFIACMRSSCKIIQAIPVIECGAADAYGFDDVEVALICASHPGGEQQIAGVRSMLNKASVPESALKSGLGINDNCSGKHTGMLAAIQFFGEVIDSYLDRSHPHQQRILDCFCDLAGIRSASVGIATDGCGAPIFFTPIRAAAKAFAKIATPDSFQPGPRREAVERIARAICAHSEMTGEPNHREMLGGRDIVLTKAGGSGYLAAGVLGKGIGAAVKIEDGTGTPVRPVLFEALRRANAISEEDACALIRNVTPKILNRAGLEIGRFELLF
ncbi:MAG: asparaginase [Planctomycetota bacterium]